MGLHEYLPQHRQLCEEADFMKQRSPWLQAQLVGESVEKPRARENPEVPHRQGLVGFGEDVDQPDKQERRNIL